MATAVGAMRVGGDCALGARAVVQSRSSAAGETDGEGVGVEDGMNSRALNSSAVVHCRREGHGLGVVVNGTRLKTRAREEARRCHWRSSVGRVERAYAAGALDARLLRSVDSQSCERPGQFVSNQRSGSRVIIPSGRRTVWDEKRGSPRTCSGSACL